MTLRSRSFMWWALITLALLVVTNIITAILATSRERDGTAAVHTGDDPAKTKCVNDAKTVTDTIIGDKLRLEIIFSSNCEAGWGRITRLDDVGFGNRITVSVYRRSDPNGPSRQDAVEPDVKSAYTTLIVRQNPTDRLCVTGSSFTGKDAVEVPEPICT